MKENLMDLDFDRIQNILEEMNNHFRFARKDFGFVRSFKGVREVAEQLMQIGQPYRLIEGRIMFLRKGRVHIRLNLREQFLQAPVAVILSPGTVGEVIDFSDECDFAIIAFRDTFMEKFRRESFLQSYYQRRLCFCIPLQECDRLRMETLLSLLWDILHDTPYPEDITREMILLLFKQIELYRQKYLPDRINPVSHQEDILTRFIDLVNEYAVKERKIPFYADKLCLTPHYLSFLIRRTSGQTVMNWINRAVIQETQIQLLHSNLRISEIADRLNFPNASFFCKYFRRLTGMSPQEYRLMNQND